MSKLRRFMKTKKTKKPSPFFSSKNADQRRDQLNRYFNSFGRTLAEEEADRILEKFDGKNPSVHDVDEYINDECLGREMNDAEIEYKERHPKEIQIDN